MHTKIYSYGPGKESPTAFGPKFNPKKDTTIATLKEESAWVEKKISEYSNRHLPYDWLLVYAENLKSEIAKFNQCNV